MLLAFNYGVIWLIF